MAENMKIMNQILDRFKKLDLADLEYIAGKLAVEIQQKTAPVATDADKEQNLVF